MFTLRILSVCYFIAMTAASYAAVPVDYLGTPFDDAAYRQKMDEQATAKPQSRDSFSPAFSIWDGKTSTQNGQGQVGTAETAASIALEEPDADGRRLIHYRNSGSGHYSIFAWNWSSPINLDQYDAVSFAIKIDGPKKMAELYAGFGYHNPAPVSLRAYDADFADGAWHTITIPLRDFRWNLVSLKLDRTEVRGLTFMTYLWDKSEYEIFLDSITLEKSKISGPKAEKSSNTAQTAATACQAIPGRIECAFFDLGGEGVAYHDTDPINVLSGVLNQQKNHQRPKSNPYYWNFRKDEGVDISYTKDFADFGHPNMVDPPENQLYIGSASDGEWCNYTVDVKKPGRYKIVALYGNDANPFSFSINHELACECKFPTATGSMHKWNKAEVGFITFPEAGRQLLTLNYNKGNNFAYFEFEPGEAQEPK